MRQAGLIAVAMVFVICGTTLAAEKSDSKVKMNVVAAKPGADGTQVLTITLDITPKWHLYANPVGNQMLEPNATKVTVLAKDKPSEAKVDYPEGKLVVDPAVGNYQIYDGKVQIKTTVKRTAGDGPLKVSVKVQACRDGPDGLCLLSAAVEQKID